MTFSLYDASVPVFANALADMRAWLDKAAAEKPESELIEARLAEPRLFNQLFSRATQYMEVLYQQHQAFAGDPRTTELAGRAQARIDEAFAKARAMRD